MEVFSRKEGSLSSTLQAVDIAEAAGPVSRKDEMAAEAYKRSAAVGEAQR